MLFEIFIEDIEKGTLKRFHFARQDESNSFSKIHNFRVPSFWSEKPNTNLDSQVILKK